MRSWTRKNEIPANVWSYHGNMLLFNILFPFLLIRLTELPRSKMFDTKQKHFLLYTAFLSLKIKLITLFLELICSICETLKTRGEIRNSS